MKKKYLIVVADYYKDIAKGLIKSAIKVIPKKNIINQKFELNKNEYIEINKSS